MKKRFSLVLDPQSIYDVIDQNLIRSDLYQCHLAATQLQLRILKVIIYIGLNGVLYLNWARFQFQRKYLHKPCCQNAHQFLKAYQASLQYLMQKGVI